MGFLHRIRSSLSNIITPDPVYRSPPVRNALDVNQLKMTMSTFSQPVWGPEINTVGNYSREGYTSRTFDIPSQPFSSMVNAMRYDEDVQLAINHLSSQITGGKHYWKGLSESIAEYMTTFSTNLGFDIFDTILVKELLAYGNSVWKARGGITNLQTMDDLMHIPISSFVRIWWDRARQPYKYEFRGPEYQGYHNPDEIIHFVWNPINASAFGTGLLNAMVASRAFMQITVDGPEEAELPSMLDRKYSTQLTMHLTERRYIPRNAFIAMEANQSERDQLKADLRKLSPNEDFVFGSQVEVKELGAVQRAFDPSLFMDNVTGPIMKALNDFRGKQGSESSHQYANAKSSAILDEIGLASFPQSVTKQLIEKLFKPWYESNPIYSEEFGGGIISMQWEDCEYNLNFGEVEKTDIEVTELMQLIDSAVRNGAINDPLELRDLYERAGLPLSKEATNLMNQQYNDPTGMMAMQNLNIPQEQQMPIWNTAGADLQSRPMDNAIYNDMMVNVRPTDPRLNFTETKKRISRTPLRYGILK